MYNGANPTLSSGVDQDTKMFGLHEISQTYQCITSEYIQIKTQKEIEEW